MCARATVPIGVGGWAFRVCRPLEADRASGTAAALYAPRLLGSGRGHRARSGNLLRSFQNASISPSSLRFSPRRTGNRPLCLPARLFLGILAVCAPDSHTCRLRRQPTLPFGVFFACFDSNLESLHVVVPLLDEECEVASKTSRDRDQKLCGTNTARTTTTNQPFFSHIHPPRSPRDQRHGMLGSALDAHPCA